MNAGRGISSGVLCECNISVHHFLYEHSTLVIAMEDARAARVISKRISFLTRYCERDVCFTAYHQIILYYSRVGNFSRYRRRRVFGEVRVAGDENYILLLSSAVVIDLSVLHARRRPANIIIAFETTRVFPNEHLSVIFFDEKFRFSASSKSDKSPDDGRRIIPFRRRRDVPTMSIPRARALIIEFSGVLSTEFVI